MLTTTKDQVTNWKKDLQKYEKTKQRLQWKKPPPVKIVHDWDVRSKDYNFNPILQKYNAPDAEKAAQHREAATRAAEVQTRSRSTRHEQDYNIINFSEKPKSRVTAKYSSMERGPEGNSKAANKGVENELPANIMKRKRESQQKMHETKTPSRYLKRPVAGDSRRFNQLKVVNADIRFIDNVSVVARLR